MSEPDANEQVRATPANAPVDATGSPPEPVRLPMVNWYDPLQLIRTGIDVLASIVVGPRADYRLIEALTEEQEPFAYAEGDDGFWLDYVADVADGWDSTFTVASLLARKELALDIDGQTKVLPRGSVLVMGGDEVYPSASRRDYADRLVGPYRAALRSAKPVADVFALPGNHDWYDGLVSFTRLFCQGRTLGAWQTRQKSSYFALKLPHGVWLLGVDLQLESDIDRSQRAYFCEVAKKMQPGDRVILCTPEPDWIYGNIYSDDSQHNLAFLEHLLTRENNVRIVLRVAGDLHHYRRHVSAEGTHNVTAGGGGAFLHPTHTHKVATIYGARLDREGEPSAKHEEYRLAKEYPSRRESRSHTRKNLLFLGYNRSFGLLAGAGYFALAAVLPPPDATDTFAHLLHNGVVALVAQPSFLLAVLGVLGAFVVFTDTSSPTYKRLGGMIHGGAHLTGALVVTWFAHRVALALGLHPKSLAEQSAALFFVLVGGVLVGSTLLGLYLYVSANVWRRHSNEAFSALRITGYNHFLRLHIARDGALTVYPLAVTGVPRSWRAAGATSDGEGPSVVPDGGAVLGVKLVEAPLRPGAVLTDAEWAALGAKGR